MLGNKEGLVSVHVCVCVYVCLCVRTRTPKRFFFLPWERPGGDSPKEKTRREKKMTENSIFVMFYVSVIYLYNRQGAQMEGLGPGSWEAPHPRPTAPANAPFPRAPAPLFPAQLLSEF